MIKVYASGINDLTVARYVAAMNVDLVGYKTNAGNKASIIEMMNWIEGPQIVIEVDDPDFIEEAIVSIPCHFVYDVTEEVVLPGSLLQDNTLLPIIIRLENANQLDTLRLNLESNIYFAVEDVSNELLTKIDGLNCGLVLATGSEESVGIKSFDELEEIFEKIENLNFSNG